MNGENKPIGPAPLPDNTPPPFGGGRPPSPPQSFGATPPPGASGPPPPPPPQIDIRTMASDRESLQRSGGLGTEPKTFSPADLSKEPVFNAEITSPAGVVEKGAGGKKIGIIFGAIAILALAGAIGFFLVWPLFSGEEKPQVTKVTPPASLPTEPTPAAPTSQSFFTKPAASTEQRNLSVLTLAELSSALKTQPGEESAAVGTVKEVVLKVNNAPVTSLALLNVLIPNTGLESILESDVTSFIYYDAKGTWPGYIFKLRRGVSSAGAETSAAKIEQSTNLPDLYLVNPGTKNEGGFKSGSAAAIKTRYLSFASGASFNYGWVNNYLVISTSFNGFKKAVELLP